MGLSIKGYVLEPPRVAAANEAFTATPNNYISDQAAYNAAYPSGSEPNPRADYLVLVLEDGLLVNAQFGWTKNEYTNRFDYDGRDQRYKLLAGSVPEAVGTLLADANTNRLKVTPPTENAPTAPFRVSVGAFPGTTLASTVVLSFGTPAPGNVEILSSSGELNWNASDITTYLGQEVTFQRQQYYTPKESSGRLGIIGTDLLLNPLPATGQYPMVRIGFGLWLTPIEVVTFGPGPAAGTFEWLRSTGELQFSPADISANVGQPVYFDGTLCGYNLTLPRQSIGTVDAPGTITGLPAADGELIFRMTGNGYQFPTTQRLAVGSLFDPIGQQGVVQVLPVGPNGSVLFSLADRLLYPGQPVEVVIGDLLIERGISMRFFRCSANPTGGDPTIKDVSAIYSVGAAILADPIIGAPQVFLPAVPIDGTMTVKIEQGTGTYTNPNLPRLDVGTPPLGSLTYGYTMDFESRQLAYAQRRNLVLVPIPVTAGAASLPDTLINPINLVLELYTPSTGWQALTVGQDALIDFGAGVVSFTTTSGTEVTDGSTGTFFGASFTDSGGNFSSVASGDILVVTSTSKVYTVDAVSSPTALTTDVVGGFAGNLAYTIYNDREVLADRFWQEQLPIDPETKVERVLLLGPAVNAPPMVLPTVPFRKDVNVFFDPAVTIVTVPDDSQFSAPASMPVNQVEVSLATNNLNLKQADLASPRFRFGASTFSGTVTMVYDDSYLGSPAQGDVQITLNAGGLPAGSLRFSASDLGTSVYWVRFLRRKVDYKLTPELGFFDFTDRFLSREEALITYRQLVDGVAGDTIEERATFIVRKELLPARTAPTSVVTFNPNGHQVADDPFPAVFRGGRPQDSTQVKIDTTACTVQFLADKILTDALPHGPVLKPIENIYVDYYVYDAVGGEKTTTVLQTPMATARVDIQEGANNFVVAGDQTSTYPAGYLLRVEREEVYLIGTSVYDSGANQTTVTLGYGQVFANSYRDPKLYIPSGVTRLTNQLWRPAYFVTETTAYTLTPRGMNRFYLTGDKASTYKTGMVVFFTDSGSTFIDSYLVSGAKYDAKTGRTEITTTMNSLRQYTPGTHILKRSVRPIIEQDSAVAQTSYTPVLTQPYLVYRRIEGQPGRILTQPIDYTIDDSGSVKLTAALLPTEEVVILYTGFRLVQGGATLRASYTSVIVPTAQNGILDQILTMDYQLFAPDTFYYRVETLTNFQGEVAAQFQQDAKGASPSGGPNTSNASQPALYEQGRESVFFPEGHNANSDIVMRAFLKFFNDLVNHLEDVLQDYDGRIVGDVDGRLKFDGKIDNPVRTSWANVTNQIDDVVQVSPFPISVLIPPIPPTITFLGTFQKVYLPGKWSRFYPAYRATMVGITTAGQDTPAADDDTILDFGWRPVISSKPVLFRRWPRGLVVKDAKAGDTVLYVDNATGASDPVLRPPFAPLMVVMVASSTTIYVPDLIPLTVLAVVPGPPDQLLVSALPVDVPTGATVYLCTTGPSKDTTYQKNYRVFQDVTLDMLNGQIRYIEPYWPFDGSFPITELNIQAPYANEMLQMNGVQTAYSSLEPYRFPALDGKAVSDCNDQVVPMLLSTNQEQLKLTHVTDGTTSLVADTTPTTVLTGDLDAPRTTITATAPFVAPLPQVYDLVRIITGVNSTAGYRRISSVGASTVTVDTAFPTLDTGFSFVVTAAANIYSSVFLVTTPTQITDTGIMPPTVHAGHTVVALNGNNIGQRRQAAQVLTAFNVIYLDYPFDTWPNTSTLYKIYNPLSTYSNTGNITGPFNDLLTVLRDNDHNVTPTVIDSEINAIDRALDGDPVAGTDGAFTDLIPGGSTGTASADTLTDGTQDFMALGVSNINFVYVRTGANQGLYPVDSVTSPTVLKLTSSFPTPGAVTYRVVSLFGLTKPGVQDCLCALKKTEDFVDTIEGFLTLLTTLEPVVLPSGPSATTYATALLSTDITNLTSNVSTRQADLTGLLIPLIADVLANKERLYDQRFTWIDARINQKSGVRAKVTLAMSERLNKIVEQNRNMAKFAAAKKLQAPAPPTDAEKGYTPSCP